MSLRISVPEYASSAYARGSADKPVRVAVKLYGAFGDKQAGYPRAIRRVGDTGVIRDQRVFKRNNRAFCITLVNVDYIITVLS